MLAGACGGSGSVSGTVPFTGRDSAALEEEYAVLDAWDMLGVMLERAR